MRIKHKNTHRYTEVFLLMILLAGPAVWYFGYHRPAPQTIGAEPRPAEKPRPPFIPPLTETPHFIKDINTLHPLPTEATQQLEQLKTQAKAYTAQLKSGEIEFSVTLIQVCPPETKNFFVEIWESARDRLKPPKEKAAAYDVVGNWDITYRFEGDTEFFDIKARKKRDMNGAPIVPLLKHDHIRTDIYQKTHHQFLRHRKQTLYIRDGTAWQLFDKWRLSRPETQHIDFYPRYNPYWWILGSEDTFNRFIDRHKIAEIKTTDSDGNAQNSLQAYRTEKTQSTARAIKNEFWLHAEAAPFPQRLLISTRTAMLQPEYEEGGFFSTPTPVLGKYNYSESVSFRGLTSELAQYNGGIWFLKTVIEEDFRGSNRSQLFPDLPISEYPLIMSAAHLPEGVREECQKAPRWRRVMKVHRAVFNKPNLYNRTHIPK